MKKREFNIKKIVDSINAFGKENKMNGKVLFGVVLFIITLISTKSFFYSLLYLTLSLIIGIQSLRGYFLNIIDIIEPGIYFLIKKYLPDISTSIKLIIQRIYHGVGSVLLIVLGYLFLSHVDSIVSLYYSAELKKDIGDALTIWVIASTIYLLLGNLFKIVYQLYKITVNYVFLSSFIVILFLLDSTYSNFYISFLPFIILLLYIKYIYNKEYNNSYIYYKLGFNESKNSWKDYIEFIKNKSLEKTKNISVISDSPIYYKNEDIFGYSNIAENAYNLIKGIDAINSSYSIGIIGEWGLGKSSIIGILKESRLKLDSNIILHDFNPWNYNKNDLVNNFITGIASKVGKKDLTKLLIEYTETLSGVNSAIGVVFKLVKSIFWKERTIEEVRDLISEELGKTNKKLVIVIDDLDRCEPEEIITMLNVVKNIGNFSHVIYLISFDKIHIIEALKEKGFHEDYIEKIINTEIHIPLPDKETKARYFTEKFSEILSEISIKKEIVEESCRVIIKEGTSGLDTIFDMENLRFIKKLLNKLNVSLKLIYNSEVRKISNLTVEDIKYIVLINYIKIKNLELFNDLLGKRLSIQPGNSFIRNSPNIPRIYVGMKQKMLENMFIEEVVGLHVNIVDNGALIEISNYKDNSDRKYLLIQNQELLKAFS